MKTMITVAKNSNNMEFLNYAYSIGIRDFRINMDYEDQAYDAISKIKSLSLKDSFIYADFQGIKTRLQLPANIEELRVVKGNRLTISKSPNNYPYISNFDLVSEYIKIGDTISFADEKIRGIVIDSNRSTITVEFTYVQYVLRQNAGCSFNCLNMPSLHMTKETCNKIKQSKAIQEKMIDWVILSFVESEDDIKDFACDMHKFGIKIMAKVETSKGIENLMNISSSVDGIMIGRGDLKNTTHGDYQTYYDKALRSLSCVSPKLYRGVGTFFLSEYSQTGKLLHKEIEDVKKIKDYGLDYIMLSKEVVNSRYPYETINILQKL